MCYDLANSEDLALAKVKAHQVRALAASQAFYNNAPIESVPVTIRFLLSI